MLKIHQVSCGNMSPFGGRFVDGFSHGLYAKLVCHCWIIETEQGLVLIDTGLGAQPAIGPFFRKLMRPRPALRSTALAQVERLGFTAADVKHILLTCMDFDHTGGLNDFPHAQVHVLEREKTAAERRAGWLDRRRYRPKQWSKITTWHTYQPGSDTWYGFEACPQLKGLPEAIKLIALPGHSQGNAGVAVNTKDGWMLHAGDAYFYRREVEPGRYHCTLGLRLYQRLLEVSHSLRVRTQNRLRNLVKDHSSEVRVCSTHDFIELTAYQASAEPIRKLRTLAKLEHADTAL